MLYQISVAERGLTGIANIFGSRLSGLDDLLRAGTAPLSEKTFFSMIPLKATSSLKMTISSYIFG